MTYITYVHTYMHAMTYITYVETVVKNYL